MKTRTILLGLMLLSLFCASAIPARAQTGNADFQQAVAAYQQSQTTEAAEKVIRMAAVMEQLPPIPEEARRHFVRGAALFKDAKSPDDYKQVDDEFLQAAHIAPWWPDARYNYALALEASGHYADAIAALKLYLLFKLPETDARAVQDKIYALEAKQEKAAKAKQEESSPAGIAAKRQQKQQELLGRLNGTRYFCGKYHMITVQGNRLIFSELFDDGVWRNAGDDVLDGLVATHSDSCLNAQGPRGGGIRDKYTHRATISDNGSSIDYLGADAVCGMVWTYRINDDNPNDCDEKCVDGSRVRKDSRQWCPD